MFGESVLCMAVAIYFEARAESFYGQLLVANTIQNRVESRHYPNDHCSVVTQSKQFSFLNNASKENPLIIKDMNAFITAIAAADFYYKNKPEYYNGCHYATPAVLNSWTLAYDMVLTTKGHFFYEGGCNDIKGRKRKVTQTIAGR